MRKKIVASILSLSLLISLFGSVSYANLQYAVEANSVTLTVDRSIGQDPISKRTIITPKLIVKWDDRDPWGGDPSVETIHDPSFYDIFTDNLTTGETNTDDPIRIEVNNNFTDNTVALHDYVSLATGSLYKISVRPGHNHLNEEGTGYEQAPNTGLDEFAYAITDPSVHFIVGKDPEFENRDYIEVYWDDLGVDTFDYQIYYAEGNHVNDTLTEFKALATKTEAIRAADLGQYPDAVDKRNKLFYRVTENITSGKTYSFYVEPLVSTYNNKEVERNLYRPVIHEVTTNINLDAYEDGNFVRLEWDIPSPARLGTDDQEYSLTSGILRETTGAETKIVATFNKIENVGNAVEIGYYRLPKPTGEVTYELEFVYTRQDGDGDLFSISSYSDKETFVPSELKITPTRPPILNLYTEEVLEDIKQEKDDDGSTKYQTDTAIVQALKSSNYMLTDDNYVGKPEDLLQLYNTFHIMPDKTGFNFVWGTFERKYLGDDTDDLKYGDFYRDLEVDYEIKVVDELFTLAGAIPVIDDRNYGVHTPNNLIENDTEVIGIQEVINEYYDAEVGELVELEPNKVYYVQIIAKKTDGGVVYSSEPNITSLYFTYDGDAFEPPTIAKPPLKIDDEFTTQNSVTITWKESWYEVISPKVKQGEVLSTWNNILWGDNSGVLYNDYKANATVFEIYRGESEITLLEDYLVTHGYTTRDEVDDYLITREVDLGIDKDRVSDVHYLFARFQYATIQEEINNMNENGDLNYEYTFNNWYEDRIAADLDDSKPINWAEINPRVAGNFNEWLAYEESGLMPNTSYLFMLYPYRTLYNGEVLLAHYPTPIVVSTDPEEVDVIPDPTVPNLYLVDELISDIQIGVTWKYNHDFNYEIVYSTTEEFSTAEVYEWTLPDNKFDPNYPDNGDFFELEVKNLFPDTEYYFWIRAIQPDAASDVPRWSNAILGKTHDVPTPPLPKGFGIASEKSMIKYGYSESVTDDYFALEWLLLDEDIEAMNADGDGSLIKNYAYILEIADNERFIDAIYIESAGGDDTAPVTAELLEKNLIKLNELVPNRAYYIRLKTRVAVMGDDKNIVKDSIGYTSTIKIITVASNAEYDGDYDPALEILPSEDFELIYDKDDGTLVFRIRDDEEGDNNVDQRLISEMINQNIYTYDIDLSSFGTEDIKQRVIKIPYSVMEAFNQYKVGLAIDAGDMTIDLPYEAIESELSKQANQYGAQPTVEITIDTLEDKTLKAPELGLSSAATPHELEIRVKSQKANTALNFTDKYFTVGLTGNSRYTLYEQDYRSYVYDYRNDWNEVDAKYDQYNNQLVFETARPGIYAAYTVDGNETNTVSEEAKTHWSDSYRESIFNQYDINNLNPYDPTANVSQQAMVQIVTAMVTGDTSIDITHHIPDKTIETLQNAGIKTSKFNKTAGLMRQEAISMMVKAYEIKEDTVVSYDQSDYNSVMSDSTISNGYAKNLAKAVSLGFISDPMNMRPTDPITYGELFKVWAVAEQ